MVEALGVGQSVSHRTVVCGPANGGRGMVSGGNLAAAARVSLS